ncbi:hypothetical protein A1Q1_00199 [Trichosporon asahii var. asahii CBS 2479]|uniref:Uncharacterized protein n=1 Tax=Trichosporon asahii var. asahii (strain ATCC 90039 / CBS 2479 / JCM 2466 / KCTC 7840 / NBRC 103889/ NCYC 2677 / UAMH 7654) TaxID=1186058 RepID=J5TEE6_TRIAS|nr:hypothetical protein A1Q1_00199 [Trichosporon asahii var. asahii CBS 2479]EJT50501.1 hypothetical protein A1Q1_00199 [Trichosporon asahii var. asahii CBS 2479]
MFELPPDQLRSDRSLRTSGPNTKSSLGCRGRQAIRTTRNGYDHVADRLTSELTTAIHQATSAAQHTRALGTSSAFRLQPSTHITPHKTLNSSSIVSSSPVRASAEIFFSPPTLAFLPSPPSLVRPVRRSPTTQAPPPSSLAGSKPHAFTPQHARTSFSTSASSASSSVPSNPCTHATPSGALAVDRFVLE